MPELHTGRPDADRVESESPTKDEPAPADAGYTEEEEEEVRKRLEDLGYVE
jgi:hypothetical protein